MPTSDPTARADVPRPDRRTLLRGMAVVGVAGLGGSALAGCGGEDEPAATGSGTGGSASSAPATTPSGSASASSTASAAGGAAIAKTADVPVGSGLIVKDKKVVVTQPTAGNFKAFDTTCTHMRCPVGSVSGKTIICPCHGSAFSVEDGSPTVNPQLGKPGPAKAPLAEVKVAVSGDSVVLA